MSDLCLTLLCPPGMEENLLDWLLMSPHAAVFTSAPTAAHGLAFGHLSATEQVLGRASAVQIQLIFPEKDKAHLIAHLKREFAGTGLRYWLMPVLEAGEVA
jgi:hypothetical protein